MLTNKREMLRRKVQEYAWINKLPESKVWESLVKLYEEKYKINLENEKAIYCKENNIDFLGLPEFLEIKGLTAIMNMRVVFDKFEGYYV